MLIDLNHHHQSSQEGTILKYVFFEKYLIPYFETDFLSDSFQQQTGNNQEGFSNYINSETGLSSRPNKHMLAFRENSLAEINAVIHSLQNHWSSIRTNNDSHVFKNLNELLIKYLELTSSFKIKKPNWSTVYLRHLSQIYQVKNPELCLPYFKIACQLSNQFNIGRLLQLLKRQQIFQSTLKIVQLKANYFKHINDPKSYSFFEKVSIKLCLYISSLKIKNEEYQELFKHYLIPLALNVQAGIKEKMRKMITSALDAYFVYCIHHHSQMPELKLNIFYLIENFINLNSNSTSLQQNIHPCLMNFISLLKKQIVVKFASVFSQTSRIPQIMDRVITFIFQLQQNKTITQSKIAEHFCTVALSIKNPQYFFRTQWLTLSNQNSTKLQCIKNIITFNHQLLKLKPDCSSCILTTLYDYVNDNFKHIFSQFNQDDTKNIIHYLIKTLGSFLQKVDPKMKNSLYQRCQNFKREQMKSIPKWILLFKMMNNIVQMTNNLQHYEEITATFKEYQFYALFANCFLNSTQETIQQLLSFFHENINLLKEPYFAFSHVRILDCLNKLCLNQQFSGKIYHFVPIFSKFDFRHLLTISKFHTIFFSFRNPQHSKKNENLKRNQVVFTSKILQLQILAALKAFNNIHKSQQEKIKENWTDLLAIIINLVGQYFDNFQQDSLQNILKMLTTLKVKTDNLNFLNIYKHSIAKQIFFIINREQLLFSARQKQILSNNFQLYSKILDLQAQLSLFEKIQILDFTFNAKSQLFCLSNRIEKSQYSPARQFIQNLIENIDNLELKFLEKPAAEFIHYLSHIIQQNKSVSLQLLASVSIKQIYFLLYANTFAFEKVQGVRKANTQEDVNQSSNSKRKQFNFIQQQLQNSATLLKIVKAKCHELKFAFKRILKSNEYLMTLGHLQFYKISDEISAQLPTLCLYLQDLIYIVFLTGLTEFKNYLISLRLSIIRQFYNTQLFFFELSRLITLELFEPTQSQILSSLILKQIQCSANNYSQKFISATTLMLQGNISEKLYQEKRIFRFLTFLKMDPLVMVMDIKSFILTLCNHVFSFPHLPLEMENVNIILKLSKLQKIQGYQTNQRWFNEIWEQDWSFLRILVISITKTFQKIIQLNSLSKLRSLLIFATTFFIRSGHFGQLVLPLQVIMIKKKQLDLLRIADSLKKIVANEIDQNEYKKIDKILWNKRKSLSMGLNLEGFSKIINNSFKDAGKIGFVLSEIFTMIVFEMLGVNQWQKIKCKSQLSIYRDGVNCKAIPLLSLAYKSKNSSVQSELNDVKQLCNKLPQILFIDYQHALILKDYISQFLDEAIQHSNLLSKDENFQIDKLICKIAISFQEFNYTLKQLWNRHYFKLSFSDSKIQPIKKCQQFLSNYELTKNNYNASIQSKISELKNIKYPLSIIFPIGSYVYNICCKDFLLITFVKRVHFEDKISIFSNIIKNNEEILSSKQLNTTANYNKRKGFDSELGKIVSTSDIGIVDFDIKKIINLHSITEITRIHPSLAKFVMAKQKQSSSHLETFIQRYKLGKKQAIKTKINYARIDIEHQNIFKQQVYHENLLLYLHYKYLPFAMEGIHSVLQYKATYRIPSIQYLIDNQARTFHFDINQCKYLVNTKNDLPSTEKTFYNIKQKFNRWTGIVGRVPPLEEIIHFFDRDLYLYMGHGTGFEHIPSTEYYNFNPKSAMLIFGCSSSHMTYDHSQPFGAGFDMLMRGCPAYLGCLWNVTDIDLDKVTAEILSYQFEENLSTILSKSKYKCLYPNLNGASLVVYGLPSILFKT